MELPAFKAAKPDWCPSVDKGSFLPVSGPAVLRAPTSAGNVALHPRLCRPTLPREVHLKSPRRTGLCFGTEGSVKQQPVWMAPCHGLTVNRMTC